MERLRLLLCTHWRCALVAVACLAMGAVGGRCSAPERVRFEERVVTEYQDRVQWWGGYTEKRVEGPTKIKIVERDRPAAPVPPGCPPCPPVHEVETNIETPGSTTEIAAQSGGSREKRGRQEAVRVEDPVLSRYRVGALVGAQVVPLAFPPQPMLGGQVEMKIGEIPVVRAPVWAGAWAVTTPQRFPDPTFAGLSITVELP